MYQHRERFAVRERGDRWQTPAGSHWIWSNGPIFHLLVFLRGSLFGRIPEGIVQAPVFVERKVLW